MTDPLKGQRKAVNDRKATVLRWPAVHECPVAKGERYPLQSCVIEIETVSRKLVKGRPAEWQATFIRHEQDRVFNLRQNPPSHASSEKDAHLDISAAEKARRDGSYTASNATAVPHEPESVGPDWKDTGAAGRELVRQDERKARMTADQQDAEVDKAAARLKQVGKTLGRDGHDLTHFLADLYERMATEEREAV